MKLQESQKQKRLKLQGYEKQERRTFGPRRTEWPEGAERDAHLHSLDKSEHSRRCRKVRQGKYQVALTPHAKERAARGRAAPSAAPPGSAKGAHS